MANKVDIVVGASDRATEILRSITDQTSILADTLDRTEQSAKTVTISMGGVTAAAAALAGAYAGLKAGESAFAFLTDSSEEFQRVEKSLKSLRSSIENFSNIDVKPIEVGEFKFDPSSMKPVEIEISIDGKIDENSIREFARKIENATNIDETEVFKTLRSALTKGFDVSEIDEATKAAIGLSSVLEISLSEGLSKVQQAAEGNFAAFENVIPGIERMATVDEKLAAVSELAAKGLASKADAADDAVSVFDRMNVQLNNLYETVGGIIEPFRQLAYQGIATVAELLSQALAPAISDFESKFSDMGDTVSSISQWITETIVGAFTLAEVVFEQFGTVMEGFGAALLLPLEQARGGFEYFFVDLVPALASWLAENVWEIFYDLGEGIITVFSNLGTSIGEIMAGVWNYIANGFSADSYEQLMFEVGRAGTRGFLDGFEPVTKAFEAPPVRISEFERTLQSMSDGAATSILTSFDTKFKERMGAIQDGFKKPFDANVDIKPKGSSLDGMSSEVKVLQATESRLLTRGATDDPLLKTSEQQLKILQELLNATVQKNDMKSDWSSGLILEGVD